MQEHLCISKRLGLEELAPIHSNHPLLHISNKMLLSEEPTHSMCSSLHHGQISLLPTQLKNTLQGVLDTNSLLTLLLISHTLIPTTSPNLKSNNVSIDFDGNEL